MRRGCTVPSPLTWPSTKKSDGTEKLAMTGSVDVCSVLPETQFVVTRLRVDTARVLAVAGSLYPIGAAGERTEFGIQQPLGAPLLFFFTRLSPEVFSTRGMLLQDSGDSNSEFSLSYENC